MNKLAIHPLIYVRGYAMTQSEIEDTVADPYMGFNIGSSKVRQLWDGSVKKYFFESPIVRLLKSFKYEDVFEEGYDRVSDLTAPNDGRWHRASGAVSLHSHLPLLRAFVCRFWQRPSRHGPFRGRFERPDPQAARAHLSRRRKNRDHPPRARGRGSCPTTSFASYLIAHSMGGLVCRAFLQNPKYGSAGAPALVDKLFTYATPHDRN